MSDVPDGRAGDGRGLQPQRVGVTGQPGPVIARPTFGDVLWARYLLETEEHDRQACTCEGTTRYPTLQPGCARFALKLRREYQLNGRPPANLLELSLNGLRQMIDDTKEDVQVTPRPCPLCGRRIIGSHACSTVPRPVHPRPRKGSK